MSKPLMSGKIAVGGPTVYNPLPKNCTALELGEEVSIDPNSVRLNGSGRNAIITVQPNERNNGDTVAREICIGAVMFHRPEDRDEVRKIINRAMQQKRRAQTTNNKNIRSERQKA